MLRALGQGEDSFKIDNLRCGGRDVGKLLAQQMQVFQIVHVTIISCKDNIFSLIAKIKEIHVVFFRVKFVYVGYFL